MRFRHSSKLIVLLVFVIVGVWWGASVYNGPDDNIVVEGASPIAQMESLARIISQRDESGVVRVQFVAFDGDENAWKFSVFVGLPAREMGASSDARYASAIEEVFVEASKLLSGRGGALVVTSVFSDLQARLDATTSLAQIARDPENWGNYLKAPDSAEFITSTEYKQLQGK